MKKIYAALFSMVILFANFTFGQNKKICVISDIHYFNPALLISDGPAFQTYLAMDRKLLKESEAILQSVLDTIIALQPEILLIPGDLTKDGELLSHSKVAQYLDTVEQNGIKVFVCPGNHDINNPHALSYDFDTVYSVASVNPLQFDSIYSNFGFSEAFEKDSSSLSYIVEPFPGLQILSIDICKYNNNDTLGYPETSGAYNPQTLDWVKTKIQEATNNGKTLLAMQHHGMLEHYAGQKALFSEYVIDDWDSISTLLANLGLKIVFTGHFHAQDMVKKVTSQGFPIYDIETGSTVTYPCPYRIIELTEDTTLIVSGDSIQNIEYDLGGLDFNTYSRNYIETGLPLLVNYMLMSPPYNLDSTTTAMIEPAITEAFIAHYKGDEGSPSAYSQMIIDTLLTFPDPSIAYALLSIWNDPQPGDWQVEIDLNESYENVNEKLLISNILVFPNPAQDYLNIVFGKELSSQVEIQLLDIMGNSIIKKTESEPNIVLNLKDINAGAYILKIKIGSTFLSKKVIIK